MTDMTVMTATTAKAARVDSHHHVWDLAVRDQPWITDAMAPIRRSFGVDDLVPAATIAGITATVVVQTVADRTETEDLLDLAARSPLVAGVVGWVDLESPDVADQLDRLLGTPSGSWLVGIRSLVQAEPDPSWLLRPSVIAALREVAARDLTFDLLVRSDQLGAAAGAAAAVPTGRFVLDHLAKPGIATRGWEPWATHLTELASCGNVAAKVSGLVTEADWSAWTVDDLRPYVDHALESFGPQRLLFGSDWPVCTLAATYGEVVAATEVLTAALDPTERDAILGGNATALYRLDTRAALT
jgi:L-fuconolactonase